MDEPTSGLDARAAAIVMRTVRNTVDTGRTVVCTIHQPSIDIFDAFDEVRSLLVFDILFNVTSLKN
jgi:ABC-type multidrug transport system ATPase subunit